MKSAPTCVLTAGGGWPRRIRARLLAWWPAKLIGTTAGMAGFFVAYFWILRHPAHPVTLMPLTAVDRWIGFSPAALPLYLSLWFYVSLAPGLMVERRELLSYGLAAGALAVIGLGIFFFWPTAIPPAGVDWARHPTFAFLKSVDASGNACPSLHVAFAVFTAIGLDRLLRQVGVGWLGRAGNVLWGLGILYSTVAIRQHVALDVLAGAVLGAAVASFHWRMGHPRAEPVRV